MKKNSIFLKAIAVILTLAFVFAAVPAFRYEAKAAGVKDVIPAKVRIYSRSVSNSAIEIFMVQAGYKITGLKSNSSNLKVYNTRTGASYEEGYGSELRIGCYARKEGTYKVSYTLVNGKSKIKKTTTVYAKNDGPFKSVKFAGQRLDLRDDGDYGYMAKKNSGKFEVKLNKGYKLKGIEVRSYALNGSSTKEVTKKISNKANVTLSDVPYKYSYSSSYDGTVYENTEYMVARTVFAVTYTDKYSKQEKTSTYELYRLVRWVE